MKKILADDLVIYPTDTVWGIGCSIYSQKGYNRIAEVKKTDTSKPLSIMFASVDQVCESFSLPEEVSAEWLEKYFSLESTLGLPLSMAEIPIPEWAVAGSSFVSVRVLKTASVSEIYKNLNTPFFTTSLNLTGTPPITELVRALDFQRQFASDAHFINLEQSSSLSGVSSTIIFLNENLSFEIIRKGRLIKEIENLLSNLFTN